MMADLIWVGNTLLPRELVYGVIFGGFAVLICIFIWLTPDL